MRPLIRFFSDPDYGTLIDYTTEVNGSAYSPNGGTTLSTSNVE
jgi:hypothetical protein